MGTPGPAAPSGDLAAPWQASASLNRHHTLILRAKAKRCQASSDGGVSPAVLGRFKCCRPENDPNRPWQALAALRYHPERPEKKPQGAATAVRRAGPSLAPRTDAAMAGEEGARPPVAGGGSAPPHPHEGVAPLGRAPGPPRPAPGRILVLDFQVRRLGSGTLIVI